MFAVKHQKEKRSIDPILQDLFRSRSPRRLNGARQSALAATSLFWIRGMIIPQPGGLPKESVSRLKPTRRQLAGRDYARPRTCVAAIFNDLAVAESLVASGNRPGHFALGIFATHDQTGRRRVSDVVVLPWRVID